MHNVGLDESKAGIKTVRWKEKKKKRKLRKQTNKKNIVQGNMNNLRYADNTILMAKSGEKLKILSMKVKEKSERVDLL